MSKSPSNFNKENKPGGTSMANSSGKMTDQSVLSYPKNGLEADERANNRKKNVKSTNIFSRIPSENTLGGTYKGK